MVLTKSARRALMAVAITAGAALALTGCTPPRQSEVVSGTKITVAINDVVTGLNTSTVDLNSLYNAQAVYPVIYGQNSVSGFNYYNKSLQLVKNTDFGTYEVVKQSPFTVKYTIKDGVKWSDGTQVDAADMLLAWASGTTHVMNGKGTLDDDSGELTGQTGTYWNNGAVAGVGFDNVEQTPTISDDDRSMTVVYKKFYTDWELVNPIGVSAHGTVELAYPDKYKKDADGAKKAKAELIKAIQKKDYSFLSKVSEQWNQGYKLTSMPAKDSPVLYSDGPYSVSDFQKDQSITLTANKDFKAGPSPKYEKITIRFIPDSQTQLTALQNGEIQVASGQPTADIASQLAAGIKNVDYAAAPESSFEHVDLQVTNGGPFDPKSYGGDADKALKVREAFLKAIPRDEILTKLIDPLQKGAKVLNSVVFLPGSAGYDAAVKSNSFSDYNGDATAAKKILTDAGITEPIKVRLLFSKTNTRRQNEYQIMKPALAAAGFDLEDASSTTWSSDLQNKTDSYDAALFAWILNNTGLTQNEANYVTGGANNYYGWSNSGVDTALKALDSEKDSTKAQQDLIDAETDVSKQYWSVPIFQFPGITAWDKSKVSDVSAISISPQYFWNFWEWAPVGASKSS